MSFTTETQAPFTDRLGEHVDTVHETTSTILAHLVEVVLPAFNSLPWVAHLLVGLLLVYSIIDTMQHPAYPRLNAFKPVEWLVRLPFVITGLDRLVRMIYRTCCFSK